MSNKYVKSEARFLQGLARQLVADRPGITSAEMARELGVCLRAGHEYRRQAQADAPAAVDPVALALEVLRANPRATAHDVAARLGLKRDAGRRYLNLALAALARQPAAPVASDCAPAPPPAEPQSYAVPVFSKIRP